jgi:hypothetical protein
MIVQSENIQPLGEVTVNALQTAINGNVSKSMQLPPGATSS